MTKSDDGKKMLTFLIGEKGIALNGNMLVEVLKMNQLELDLVKIIEERVREEWQGVLTGETAANLVKHMKLEQREITPGEDQKFLKLISKLDFSDKDYRSGNIVWLYIWKHDLTTCFQTLFGALPEKEKQLITMRLPINDYASLVRLRRETHKILPAKDLKRIWQLPARTVDFLFQRKHHCFFFGVPTLSHLCIDALAAAKEPKFYEKIYTLSPFLQAHLTEDDWCYFEWVYYFDKKHQKRMVQLLHDLAKSGIELNCAQKRGAKIESVHGYKSREINGVGDTIVHGATLNLTITKNPTAMQIYMDSYGYIFINTPPTEGYGAPGNAFFLTHGTQMDSLYCDGFFSYLENIGIPKDEHYAFMVIIYNWLFYGENMSSIFYPSRLCPSQWRDQNKGPSDWFKKLTYLYGFDEK
eukprot:Phypoly_transcript_09183.p1 GENE.Phypoly_transcript_09183~~Phypoly_transcript_09183.p1  ORF type:complete len:474 (+),score=69.78 Phypoly_transcript_09183:188-1423(+)